MGIDGMDSSRRRFLGIATGAAATAAGIGSVEAQQKRKTPDKQLGTQNLERPPHYETADAFARSFAKMLSSQEKLKSNEIARDEEVRSALSVYLQSFAEAREVPEATNAFNALALELALRSLPMVRGSDARALAVAQSILQYYYDEFRLLDSVGDRRNPLILMPHPEDPEKTSG